MPRNRETLISATGRIRFRRALLQTPNPVLALTEFREETSVSSSQPIVCVCQSGLTEFFAGTLETVFRLLFYNYQDDEKGGLSLRGVTVTTKTAKTAKTVKTVTVVSWYCIL